MYEQVNYNEQNGIIINESLSLNTHILPIYMYIHIQIPPDQLHVGLIWQSMRLLQLGYCWRFFEGMLQLLHAWYIPVTLAAAYPHSTLKGTTTCSSLSCRASQETCSRSVESGCVHIQAMHAVMYHTPTPHTHTTKRCELGIHSNPIYAKWGCTCNWGYPQFGTGFKTIKRGMYYLP